MSRVSCIYATKGIRPEVPMQGTTRIYIKPKINTNYKMTSFPDSKREKKSSVVLNSEKKKREWDGLYVHDITTERFIVFPEEAFYYGLECCKTMSQAIVETLRVL